VVASHTPNRLGTAAIVRWFRQLPFADNQQLLR
jgi:hypothetical protein